MGMLVNDGLGFDNTEHRGLFSQGSATPRIVASDAALRLGGSMRGSTTVLGELAVKNSYFSFHPARKPAKITLSLQERSHDCQDSLFGWLVVSVLRPRRERMRLGPKLGPSWTPTAIGASPCEAQPPGPSGHV